MANVDLPEIVKEMKEVNIKLSNSYKEMWNQSKILSHAERNYKIALHHKILELKTVGYPATLILEIAKGDERIADLRFNRDLAQGKYDTAKEAIRSLRTIATVWQTISKYQDEI